MPLANGCQFFRPNDAQRGNLLHIFFKNGSGLLNDHLIQRLGSRVIQHHRLGAFPAAIQVSWQLLAIRAKWRATNLAGWALRRTRQAIGLGGITKAEILTDNGLIAGRAARQAVQTAVAKPILINGCQVLCWLGASRAARRGAFALGADDQAGAILGILQKEPTTTEVTEFVF